MRRLIPVLLLLCFMTGFALADGIPCYCIEEPCACYIQLGDGGPAIEYIQHALIEKGYLLQNNDASLFDEHTLKAVCTFQAANNLDVTGMLDDSTLTLLLWNMTTEELDALSPFSNGRLIWIPTNGGKRRHVNSQCCKMISPRMVSVRNAEFMDMKPCGICNRGGEKE